MKCKITKKEIKPFMSFGKMPIANGFVGENDFLNEFFFNMEVGFSEEVSLFQLNEHPQPEKMFNDNYPFFTGSSKYMIKHFKDYYNFVKKYLKTDSKIIEIGSNDGTFLENFRGNFLNILGIEPSKNVAQISKKKNIPTINSFFNTETVSELNKYLGKTDLVCASNVICHVPDLDDLIKCIDLLLGPNGTFIFEEPYLGSMFSKVSYDQIYDEHIYIFSASSISKIFKKYNLHLVDIFPQSTHGGSMRYIVQRKTNQTSQNLINLLDTEKTNNLDNIKSCLDFKKNCENSKLKLVQLLKKNISEGKRIVGYGATSKSTTILNYCNIDSNIIDYICDTTKEKIGKFSPGMHIPIVSVENFRKDDAEIVYLFAWNHKDEILKKESVFTEKKREWISHVKI